VQFYGDTQSEAFAKRDAYKKQLEAGLRTEMSGLTFSQYAQKWIDIYKGNASLRYYNDILHILHAFILVAGDKLLKDYVKTDIQEAYASLNGKSKSYISKYNQTVKAVFQTAVDDRIITFNPCGKTKPPKGESGTHRAIEPWERDLILQSEHRLKPAVMCMLYAGLRRGEVLALNVDRDVDFQAMTITIREAVRFESNQPVIVDPKTEAGTRTIPLLDILAIELKGHHGLVATSVQGELLSEMGFKRAWKGFITTLEELHNGDSKRWYGRHSEQKSETLPPWQKITIRPHDLRHSFCTMLYDTGIDLKTAQKWMGHADQTMTLRVYTHLTEEREAAAARQLRDKVNERVQNGVQVPEGFRDNIKKSS
jgi:integrase